MAKQISHDTSLTQSLMRMNSILVNQLVCDKKIQIHGCEILLQSNIG